MKASILFHLRSALLSTLLICFSLNSSHAQFMKKLLDGTENLIEKGKEEINNTIYKTRAIKIHSHISDGNQSKSQEELGDYIYKFGPTANSHFLLYRFNAKFFPTNKTKLDSALYHLAEADRMERNYELCEKIGFCRNSYKTQRDSLEYHLYTAIRKNDQDLTWFISKYTNSAWKEEAFNYQTKERFAEVKKENSIEAYARFIRLNPDAIELYEATKTLHKLSCQKARQINTIDSYQTFIQNFSKSTELPEALSLQSNIAYQEAVKTNDIRGFRSFISTYRYADSDLQIKAKNKIRLLEFREIQDQLVKLQDKYRDAINKFTASDRGGYSLSLNFRKNQEELSSIEFSDGNLKFSAYETYRDVFNSIDSFIGRYKNSYESTLLTMQKNLIIETCRNVDFIALSKSGREFARDDDDVKSVDYWKWYSEFHPKSMYYDVADAKFKRVSDIARLKQEEEQRQQDQIRENERLAAEAEEAKKKEELDETFSPFTQALKLLSPADKAYYRQVMNMNSDPKGRVGVACAVGVGRCEWCGKSIRFQKTLESRINTLQMMSNPLMGGLANMMLGVANLFGQAFGGNKMNMPLKLKNEIIKELRQIRAGNLYFCSGSAPKFCSPKCEADQQFHKKYGR